MSLAGNSFPTNRVTNTKVGRCFCHLASGVQDVLRKCFESELYDLVLLCLEFTKADQTE